MSNWLSKMLGKGAADPDLATVSKGLNDLYLIVGELQKQVARTERKVYRDIAGGNGEQASDIKSVFEEAAAEKSVGIEAYGPGDQIPPGLTL
jgi:hypothetical protein